ncbi:MAG: aspartate-semialdehyde dehydrogenase [Deltaproteobacteria bacterium]|nr:aspartate-semialdehyde dehydrogenase [Deltaproteobacteria bacterium]
MKPGQDGYAVAVVGATGAVGREMLAVLEERAFPISSLRLFASSRSAGEDLLFRGRAIEVEVLPEEAPSGIDLVLFSAGSGISLEHAVGFGTTGAVVIDNSSAFRMDSAVPLVVPEVNGQRAFDALGPNGKNIIANPNCSTIQLAVALWPLHEAFGLQRVVVSTYQSVSGAGQAGIDELSQQVIALLNSGEAATPKAFPHSIAFNCIPAIGSFRDDGYTDEEWKLVAETRRILQAPYLKVVPTCVRVPVFASHSESVLVEFKGKVTSKQVRAALYNGEGISLLDAPDDDVYPMNFPTAGTDDVFVGRIRQAPDDDSAVAMWVVADNLRKGAALNAVQIAELLVEGPEEDE